jgi:hypothetical protein
MRAYFTMGRLRSVLKIDSRVSPELDVGIGKTSGINKELRHYDSSERSLLSLYS